MLRTNTLLKNGTYHIHDCISQTNELITYKGTYNDKEVLIQEFYLKNDVQRMENNAVVPMSISDTEYNTHRLHFFEAAKQLILPSSHKNLAKVFEVFYENNTAYCTSEWVEGNSLTELMENGMISADKAKNYLHQICQGVKELHKDKTLHQNITPNSIIITKNEEAILTHYGIGLGMFTSNTPNAYLAPEQYNVHSKQGIPTDIYALGACVYHLATGIAPKAAPRRIITPLPSPQSLNEAISDLGNEAIKKAMKMQPLDRFQSVEDLEDNLLVASAPKTFKETISNHTPPVSSNTITQTTVDTTITNTPQIEDLIETSKKETTVSKTIKTKNNDFWKPMALGFGILIVSGIAWLSMNKGEPQTNLSLSDAKTLQDSITIIDKKIKQSNNLKVEEVGQLTSLQQNLQERLAMEKESIPKAQTIAIKAEDKISLKGKPVKITNAGKLYTDYPIIKDEAAQKQLLKQNISLEEVEKINLLSHQSEWVPYLQRLDKRSKYRRLIEKYNTYYVGAFDYKEGKKKDMTILFVPAAEQKHIYKKMRPTKDIYMIVETASIEIME